MRVRAFISLFERLQLTNPFVASLVTKKFKKGLAELPVDVQKQARECYLKWKKDMASVDFKELGGLPGVYRVEIGRRYRAIGHVQGENFVWDWIGTHEAYNKIIERR